MRRREPFAQPRDDDQIDGDRLEHREAGIADRVDHAVAAQRRSLGELGGDLRAHRAIAAAEHGLDQVAIDQRALRIVAEDAEQPRDLAALAGREDDQQHVARHRRQIELAHELDERQPDASRDRRPDPAGRALRHRREPGVGLGELVGREPRDLAEQRADLAEARLALDRRAQPAAVPRQRDRAGGARRDEVEHVIEVRARRGVGLPRPGRGDRERRERRAERER